MKEINTKEIDNTALTGKSIDEKLKNNTTSIRINSQSFSEAVDNLKSYRGNLKTEKPTKTNILQLTESEKAMYPEANSKHEDLYETWDFSGLNDNYISIANKIAKEIGILKSLLTDIGTKFSELENSSEILEAEYNKILEDARAAGIDIGAILLHNTDAPTKSGESGDQTKDNRFSGIQEENYYLYENLGEGEYLYLVAGTGVEAGTFFIYKHTKDGKDVKTGVAMKNIGADTTKDWINKCNDALRNKNKKTRDNILKGLSPVGTGIIGLGNKLKGALNNKVNDIKTSSTVQVGAGSVDNRGYPKSTNPTSQPTDKISTVHSTTTGKKAGGGGAKLAGAGSVDNRGYPKSTNSTNSQPTGNPHKTATAQTGAGSVDNRGFPKSTDPTNSQPTGELNKATLKKQTASAAIEKANNDGEKRTNQIKEQKTQAAERAKLTQAGEAYTKKAQEDWERGTVARNARNAAETVKATNDYTIDILTKGQETTGATNNIPKASADNIPTPNLDPDLNNDISENPFKISYNPMSTSSEINPNLNHDINSDDARIMAKMFAPGTSASEREKLLEQLSPDAQAAFKK